MNATDETVTPPPPAPPPSDPAPPPGRLTRATDDKVLTGLCGGLGRHFGVDPVVFRVAFVVLSIAGGTGVLLYLAGWLLIPDDQGTAVTDRFTGSRSRNLALAILIGAGVLMLVDGWDTHWGNDSAIAVALIAAGGLWLWSRRDRSQPPAPPSPPSSPAAEVAPPAPPPPPPAPSSEAPSRDATTGGAARAAAPPKPRSALVPVTLSLLLVLGGALSLLNVTLATGLAVALLVTGGAMVVGAWRGRARGLIPVAIVLGMGLCVAAVVDVSFTGGIGERFHQPLAISELETSYRLGIGEIVVDLRRLDLTGRSESVLVTAGIGHVEVIVPPGVEVVSAGHAGAGEVVLFGASGEGTSVDRRLVSPGRDGGGRLTVDARVGIGQVEVRRAAA